MSCCTDYKTDAIIQTSLRESSDMKEVTVITIAHRLQTIMDADKIVRSNYSFDNHLYPKLDLDGPRCGETCGIWIAPRVAEIKGWTVDAVSSGKQRPRYLVEHGEGRCMTRDTGIAKPYSRKITTRTYHRQYLALSFGYLEYKLSLPAVYKWLQVPARPWNRTPQHFTLPACKKLRHVSSSRLSWVFWKCLGAACSVRIRRVGRSGCGERPCR
jgi:hypothetical protein